MFFWPSPSWNQTASTPWNQTERNMKLQQALRFSFQFVLTLDYNMYRIQLWQLSLSLLARRLVPAAPAPAPRSTPQHYKVLLLVWKSLHSMSPPYIFSLLRPCTLRPICSPLAALWMTGLSVLLAQTSGMWSLGVWASAHLLLLQRCKHNFVDELLLLNLHL